MIGLRALTYGLGATVVGAVVVYVVTGSVVVAGEVTVVDRLAKLLWYMAHDWLWERTHE
jgi:uncharacterized membrane protein